MSNDKNASINDIKIDFNNLLLDLIHNLNKICPNSIISNNMIFIEKFIKDEPVKMIEAFISYVLKYKKQIDAGDEDFFLNHSYEKDIPDKNFAKIFEFKDLWKKINKDNKKSIIIYMQYLCGLSEQYFKIVYM